MSYFKANQQLCRLISLLAASFLIGSLWTCAPLADSPLIPPYPPSEIVCTFALDWSTYETLAPGSDNWPITWAADDHQYSSWGDGGGFGGTNNSGRVSLGVARLEGSPEDMVGRNIWGGYQSPNRSTFEGKSYGILAAEQKLFMWVSPGSNVQGYSEARLAESHDSGQSWRKVPWSFTANDGIIFPTFLQYGRDYQGSPDRYVYIYAVNLKQNREILSIQTPGEIVLLRVPRSAIMKRDKFQFYAGKNDRNLPIWSHEISDRVPVFSNPAGVGWNCSVAYNFFLGRYLLVTEHSKSFEGNFSLFESPNPWGPWFTVSYLSNFGSPHIEPRSFFWNFSNKWSHSLEGDFALIFSGIKTLDSFNLVRGKFTRNCR
jgi:hypothetical protein